MSELQTGRDRAAARRRHIAALRRAAGCGGLVLLAVAGAAGAQDRLVAPAIGTTELRTQSDDTLGSEIRRPPVGDPAALTEPLRPSRSYQPFSRGAEPDELLEDILPQDVPAPPGRARRDLFVEPEDPAPGPANSAAEPARPSAAAGAAGLRGSEDAFGRQDSQNPIAGPGRAATRATSVVQPLATLRASSSAPIGGRTNLVATPLRGAIPVAEDDAFAPVGTRLGSLRLYTSSDQTLGWSSNLPETPGGSSGVFSESTLALRLLSDWSLNEAELNALASYRRNFAGEIKDDPRVSVDGRYRLDIDRLTAATFRGSIDYQRQDPLDASAGDLLAGDRPDTLNYSAAADVERRFGRIDSRVTLAALRQTTSDEGRTSASDPDYSTYTAALRAGYEISPAMRPFVEGSLGRRIFDNEIDTAGLERNSLIQALRGGLAFDLGEKFFGEASVGYAWNVPDADGQRTLSSPTFDASFTWSPRRGTDVALTAATSFDPDAAGDATSTLYQGGLALRQRITARTDLNAGLTAGYRDSDLPSEQRRTFGAEAGFTHWLNRSLALIGRASHETVDRKVDRDYDVTSFRLGIRVQR